MDPLLQVTLLGSLSAVMPQTGTLPTTHFRTQKTAALFGYLAFHAGSVQPREELIERFWPESELDQGRMSLRTALSSLRKDLGEALVTDKMTVTLIAQTDLQEFEHAIRHAHQSSLSEVEKVEQLRQSIEVYGGPLLPGLYDDWVFPERDRLAGVQRAALQALTRWHDALGEFPQAIDYARRATITDPLNEEIRAELIRLLNNNGQQAEARRQFEDLERLLVEHLGVKPSVETQALVGDQRPRVQEGTVSPPRSVVLPLSRGRFRGRRDVLTALVQRLSGGKRDAEGVRLFTLFGPGGIGKTRLAIEAARRLFAHGLVGEVRFVSLAEATTSEQLWESLFTALDLTRAATLAPLAQVAARLEQSGTCLLILDNLEQLALEAGEVASVLLEAVPGLTILATSRRRLGTLDEELFLVGALPDDEGVALFVDRARSVVPDFQPTEAERDTLRTLVGRLEGFPLAIELAAAWASALTPTEMLTQLDESLLNLPERSDGSVRHSSLTAAIRWSVSLLGPDLQYAFFALSVFRGGWFAPAAEAICGVGREALASLRDRSLLTVQAQEDQLRFGMHEALRAYGKVALSDEEKRALDSRHVDYFVVVAEQESHPARLALEYANFQQALEKATEGRLVALCLALVPFWDQQGHWQEGRRRLEQAGEQELTPVQKAELLPALARLCYNLCDAEAAARHHEAARVLALERGDERGIGRALLGLAAIRAHYHADYDEARRLTEQAQGYFSRAGNIPGQCTCLIGLGVLATIQGDLETALALQQQSLQLAEAAGALPEAATAHHRLGITYLSREDRERCQYHLSAAEALLAQLNNTAGLAYVRVDLGSLAQGRGEPQRARSHYQASLAAFRELGEIWACALCLGNLARLALATGEWGEARAHWEESLRLRLLLRDPFSMAAGLDGATNLFFCHAAAHADPVLGQEAVRLRTASVTWRAAHDAGSVDPEGYQEQESQVHTILGESTCASLEGEGSVLTLERASAHALGILQRFSV